MHYTMSTNREHVAARIATRVHAARTSRAWTFDELASRSGLSRRLLVQIEQGDANPSLTTLLKLAAALGITLTDLVQQARESPPFGVIARQDALDLWTTPEGSTAQLLVSHGPLELWSWTLQPGDRRDSEAHRPGSLELLTVATGRVRLDVADHHVEIRAGDGAWFDAAHPHAYSNPARATATFTLVVLEPAG
jgi:transcriptional regulator with XRE-family HTH domain